MKKRVSVFHCIIAVLIICTCFFVFQNINAKTKSESTRSISRYESVLIYDGDSVWSIAKTHLQDEDASDDEIAAYVEQIKSLNHISNDDRIYSGRYIIVPIYQQNKEI